MDFDFSSLKRRARQVVHSTFGVQAFYQDTPLSAPDETRARWHNKKSQFGDFDDQGYANIIEGIERVVFKASEARRLNLRRGGVISFPTLGKIEGESVEFVLNTKDDDSGPEEETWQVTVRGVK